MADFDSLWGWYVAGFVAFGLLFCVVTLMMNVSTQDPGGPQVKGHVWDENLREYNNPLPRWWLYLFWGTIIFSVVYLLIYPGFGSWNSTREKDKGLRGEYAEEIKKANDSYGPVFAKYLEKKKDGKTDLVALAENKDAMATGQRLFLTYCLQCHGSTGKGSKGFPNLTDDDWLYGSDPETIKNVITNGRGGRPGSNGGTMPARGFDASNKLNDEEVRDVANYVRSLPGNLEGVDSARADKGKVIYNEKGLCVSCHGPEGKGNPGLAPNLTAKTWLFGGSEEVVIEGITKGRNNESPDSLESIMPSWKNLGEAKIEILAAYVYSLSKKK